MYCKFCGGNIDDDSVFCRICGNKLTEGAPEENPAAPALSDEENAETSDEKNIKEEEKTALTEDKAEILARLNENVCVAAPMPDIRPAENKKSDEFYDVFAYWNGLSALRKLALFFVFGAAALWAAMLVLTVFFP